MYVLSCKLYGCYSIHQVGGWGGCPDTIWNVLKILISVAVRSSNKSWWFSALIDSTVNCHKKNCADETATVYMFRDSLHPTDWPWQVQARSDGSTLPTPPPNHPCWNPQAFTEGPLFCPCFPCSAMSSCSNDAGLCPVLLAHSHVVCLRISHFV